MTEHQACRPGADDSDLSASERHQDRSTLPEEERRDLVEVMSPHDPLVPPFPDHERVLDALRGQGRIKSFRARSGEGIVLANSHPQQLDLFVGRGGILEELRIGRIRIVGASVHHDQRMEQLGMRESHRHGLATTHRQTAQRAIVGARQCAGFAFMSADISRIRYRTQTLE